MPSKKRGTNVKIPCPLFCGMMCESKNLTRHVLYHSGLCPYMCNTCGCSFKQQKQLKDHVSKKHKNIEDGQDSQSGNDKFKVPKGFKCCGLCQAIVPAKEEKAHIESHIPVYTID